MFCAKFNMLARLTIPAWLLIICLLFFLASCQRFEQGVVQSLANDGESENSPDSAVSPVGLAATPTLRVEEPTDQSNGELPDLLSVTPSVEGEQAPVLPTRSVLLSNAAGELNRLKGVGRLLGFTTCTASLIDSGQNSDAPAYVLTAGRCVQPRSANEVYLNGLVGEMHVIFNFFADQKETQIKVPATRIAYSTMKGRDLAIVELGETVGSLRAKGIEALKLSKELVENVPEVLMISAPVVGFSPEDSFLRMEACKVAGRVDLVESQMIAYDVFRTDCQDNFSGSAGSPLLDQEDYEILGINSTTTVAGFQPCSFGAPCEVEEQGVEMRENSSYATPLTGLLGCFTAEGLFDIFLPDCELDNGRNLLLSNLLGEVTQSLVETAVGQTSPARWDTSVTGDYLYYRYKTGLINQTDCRVEAGYSEVHRLGADTIIDTQIPDEDGIYVLCAIGGDSPNGDDSEQWQSPALASAVIVKVDNTPPALDPIVVLVQDVGFYTVYLHTNPPELDHYEVKGGLLAEIDCLNHEDYRPSPREPLQIAMNQGPYKLCVIAIDAAGNKGEPYELVVGQDLSTARS